MKKTIRFLSVLLFGFAAFVSESDAVEMKKNIAKPQQQDENEQTTRSDAVIFKVHDVTPVFEDGIVTGCDFTVTLYNRTSINFRSFNINMAWDDSVDDKFRFDRYLEAFIGADEFEKQKDLVGKKDEPRPLVTSLTVNAFGSDKQISVRSHVDSDKCYLMLSKADYTVSPCDIARSVDTATGKGLESNECTPLFQFVDTSNPEYFGQFKKLSATDLAIQNKISEKSELSDVDEIINKIVENLDTSSSKLTNIN